MKKIKNKYLQWTSSNVAILISLLTLILYFFLVVYTKDQINILDSQIQPQFGLSIETEPLFNNKEIIVIRNNGGWLTVDDYEVINYLEILIFVDRKMLYTAKFPVSGYHFGDYKKMNENNFKNGIVLKLFEATPEYNLNILENKIELLGNINKVNIQLDRQKYLRIRYMDIRNIYHNSYFSLDGYTRVMSRKEGEKTFSDYHKDEKNNLVPSIFKLNDATIKSIVKTVKNNVKKHDHTIDLSKNLNY